jgi:mitogen-activated protein kinase 7
MPSESKPTRGFAASPDPRYKFLKQLGSGSYGCVAAVRDLKHGVDVAMKKISDLRDFTVCRRTLREIQLMRHFRHRNLLHLEDVLALTRDANAVYVVTPLMDCDLRTLLHKRSGSLTGSHVRGFLSQMLLGLLHLHSGHVIHRDLKPANIFVRKDGLLKIGDLGLSRGIDLEDDSLEPLRQPDEQLTEYVVTRWWRAPEVLLTPSQYGPPVDVWSIGCILSEMITGTALFPGKSSFDQLKRQLAILGTPTGEYARGLRCVPGWKMIRQLPICNPNHAKLRGNWRIPANEGLSDLLEQMIAFNPYERITLELALAHPALEHLYSPTAIADSKNIAVFDQDCDKEYDGLSRAEQKVALSEVAERLLKEVESIRTQAEKKHLDPPSGSHPSDNMGAKSSSVGPATRPWEPGCLRPGFSTRSHKDHGHRASLAADQATKDATDPVLGHAACESKRQGQEDEVRDRRRSSSESQHEDRARERCLSSRLHFQEEQVLAARESARSMSTEKEYRRRLGRDMSAPAVSRASAHAGLATQRPFEPPPRRVECSRTSLAKTLPGDLQENIRAGRWTRRLQEGIRSQHLKREPPSRAPWLDASLWLEEGAKKVDKPSLVGSQSLALEVDARRASDSDALIRVSKKPDVTGPVVKRRWVA